MPKSTKELDPNVQKRLARPSRGRAAPRLALSLDRSGGANQADRALSNISTPVAQYNAHGTMPHVAAQNPLYDDFSEYPQDPHEMRELVHQAEERFHALPSAVRSVANNDWTQFLDLFNDPAGRQSLQAAGLIVGNPDLQTPPSPPSQPNTQGQSAPSAEPSISQPPAQQADSQNQAGGLPGSIGSVGGGVP